MKFDKDNISTAFLICSIIWSIAYVSNGFIKRHHQSEINEKNRAAKNLQKEKSRQLEREKLEYEKEKWNLEVKKLRIEREKFEYQKKLDAQKAEK